MAAKQRFGRYEILEEIGHGGFSVVYRARDTKLSRDVALKVLQSVSSNERVFVQRFRQEACTAAGLRHPSIVPVYDFGEAEGMLYLVMALVGEGDTLRTVLAEKKPLSIAQALNILVPLASALDYLHQRDPPLIHRDVKPGNVLLEEEGESLKIALTDFGLVRSMEASSEITKSGAILGTPIYMAPEQADPKQWGEITPLSDVYALGVIVYQMLTGHVPFEGETLAVLHAHAHEPPPSPLGLVPDLGEDLAETLLQALAKSPADRYECAGALVDTLRQVVTSRADVVERELTLEQLEIKAKEFVAKSKWANVLACCAQIMQIDPNRPVAREILVKAQDGLDREKKEADRQHLEELYKEGKVALISGQWQAAITAFEKVAADDLYFRDVQEKLAQARMNKYGVALQHVITLTGSSGAGKSTAIRYFGERGADDESFVPELVPKYTTRPSRNDDLGEVVCVDEIPPQCDLVYEHCGMRYGLRLSDLFELVTEGRSPIVILNDIRAVEDVRKAFGGLVRSVFIFRDALSLEQYRDLAAVRGIKDPGEPLRRFQKAKSLYRTYIENIHLFDHVIVNKGTLAELEFQVKQIIKGLRQDPNWPLREKRTKMV